MRRIGVRTAAWAIAAAAYAVLVFIAGSVETPEGSPKYNDKLAHLLVFGGQYLLVSRALGAAGLRRGAQIAVAAAVALGVGAALELWQALLPHRSAELADFVADAAGVLAAVVGEEIVLRVRGRGNVVHQAAGRTRRPCGSNDR
jgi:VanZ family protein